MDGNPQTISAAWVQTDTLVAFIDELREAGYNIGVSQYMAAHDLVLALIARGEPLDDPYRFKRFLGPVLCSSPTEQDDFAYRYDRWLDRLGFVPVAMSDGVSTRPEILVYSRQS